MELGSLGLSHSYSMELHSVCKMKCETMISSERRGRNWLKSYPAVGNGIRGVGLSVYAARKLVKISLINGF
jgi:hypothetical protein